MSGVRTCILLADCEKQKRRVVLTDTRRFYVCPCREGVVIAFFDHHRVAHDALDVETEAHLYHARN